MPKLLLDDLAEEARAQVVREALGEPFLKLGEVAAHLGVSEQGLRKACKRGRVPHMRWNMITGGGAGQYRFSVQDVRRIREMMTVCEDPASVEGE